MHPKGIAPSVAEQGPVADRGVLMMLLVDDHPVWTVSEIKRELGDDLDVRPRRTGRGRAPDRTRRAP